MLCPGTNLANASTLAEDLRRRLGEARPPVPGMPAVSVSIGVAARDELDVSPMDLMLRADDRLYRAKRTRNTVCGGDLPVAR